MFLVKNSDFTMLDSFKKLYYNLIPPNTLEHHIKDFIIYKKESFKSMSLSSLSSIISSMLVNKEKNILDSII